MAGLVDEPRPGRRKPDLVLSEAERAKTAQFLALRARIVLRWAEGGTNREVGAELGVSQGTVNRWRSRFICLQLDGLTDEPRPGGPPSILLDQVEDGLTTTLESTPGKDTHWSRASMVKYSRLSKPTIGRVWKNFDLKPHLQDAFKLSTDLQLFAKVAEVVFLCRHPPEKAVVLRGREEPNPGAEPVPAGAADDAGCGQAHESATHHKDHPVPYQAKQSRRSPMTFIGPRLPLADQQGLQDPAAVTSRIIELPQRHPRTARTCCGR